jgi:spore germination protein YaaH
MRRARLLLIALAFIAGACILVRGGTKSVDSRRLVIGYFWSPSKKDLSNYTSARKNAEVITHLCPTRISIADTEGNVRCGKDTWLLSFGKKNGIAILPLVSNGEFSREIAHSVLNDPAKRKKVVDQLLAIIQAWKCPGINIDIENVAPADRRAFSAFMQELCDRFHEKGLAVTIDVPAKTWDNPKGGWPGAYDYVHLGKCCDLVMLMCYDEHWSGGEPGPIGSKPWVRRCLQYATRAMPRHKVVLGVPFYGYDWPKTGRAKAYTSRGVNRLLVEKKPAVQWDNKAKYHWFEYRDEDGKRTVWYEDPRSLAHKIALAQEFKIAGISIWRLGDEDPEYWKLLSKYRRGEDCLK